MTQDTREAERRDTLIQRLRLLEQHYRICADQEAGYFDDKPDFTLADALRDAREEIEALHREAERAKRLVADYDETLAARTARISSAEAALEEMRKVLRALERHNDNPARYDPHINQLIAPFLPSTPDAEEE